MAIAHKGIRSNTDRSNTIGIYNIAIFEIYNSCIWYFNTCIHSIAIIFHLQIVRVEATMRNKDSLSIIYEERNDYTVNIIQFLLTQTDFVWDFQVSVFPCDVILRK